MNLHPSVNQQKWESSFWQYMVYVGYLHEFVRLWLFGDSGYQMAIFGSSVYKIKES